MLFNQSNKIRTSFTSDPVTQQIIVITGVKGSGKAVLMNSIANMLEAEKDWIVVRLNSGKDLMQSLHARLCGNNECMVLFWLYNSSLCRKYWALEKILEHMEHFTLLRAIY